MRLLVSSGHELVVVHNGVPHGQFHLAEESEYAFELGLGDEALEHGQVGAVAHAGGDGVAVQHARRQFVARRPGVAECVRAALVRFPKVALLGSHLALHCFAHDEVAELLELWVGVSHGTKLGLD